MKNPAFPSIKCPVSTQEEYANEAGHSIQTVRGQVARGHLPTIKIGRYRMINLMQLARRCMEEDPTHTEK